MIVFITKPLDILHMNLIGPFKIRSYGGNSYILVIIDDYFIFTWTPFLKHKSDTFKAFKKLANVLQNQTEHTKSNKAYYCKS